jgi:hypothetical protein
MISDKASPCYQGYCHVNGWASPVKTVKAFALRLNARIGLQRGDATQRRTIGLHIPLARAVFELSFGSGIP